ncbi:MAG: hypothetical protein M3Y72_01985 [Acidobacteriota bacterium]|nr:hypothetical protein [Acidobacteriota bacterium]MDQ2839813.1 hypothetical protein [Acidobacteriota bacterium]
MRSNFLCLLLILSGLLLVAGRPIEAASGLNVTYGNGGVQQLSYNGTLLEDSGAYPADAFHIWHMKATDLNGNLMSGGQYGWGETNNGRSWNPVNHTWTYRFVWGTIDVQFVQAGDTLNVRVATVNNPSSGIIFDGATIYPFVLRFPQLPLGFVNASYEHFAFNSTGPSVTVADFGMGEVAAVYADASKLLYTGYQPAGAPNTYFPIISGTSIDGMATFFPHQDRPVLPGQTDFFTVSLRFAPSGTPAASLAKDAYQSWATVWPSTLQWNDRRVIGTVYLASSPGGDPTHAGGYPNNPRRYFNDSNPNDFDVRSSNGLSSFQNRILQQAQSNVQNLQKLAAQGAITWDIEGEAYPQPTSYACAPDQIAQLAPEMESVITSSSSQYAGMKLDDAYFKTMRDAGFKVGVCVRPQHYTVNADGTASQVYLPDSQIAAELIRKMRYAHDRWGATMFYVDSDVEVNDANFDASIFAQAAAALPDSLIIPEESTPKYYAYTAAFRTFIFHGDLGTPADVYNFYPNAFSANLINDVDPNKLAQYRQQLTDSVRKGDILMVHADYWQANNPTVVQMYLDAGRTSTALVP